ncbi:hypothetical protein GS885_22200 [Rhodococcus hoagii]|nr:hypothetical protein [Prescottella equi]
MADSAELRRADEARAVVGSTIPTTAVALPGPSPGRRARVTTTNRGWSLRARSATSARSG